MQDARKMKALNNNNNRKISLLHNTYLATTTTATAATIFTLTIVFASTTTTLASASTTGDNTTTSAGGEQEAASSTTTTNNASNALLGSLFMIVEFETANVNPINETYIEISTVNNVTLIPPNATGTTTINATETANVTVNILPSGLAVSKGQSIIVTNGDDGGGRIEQENATSVPVDISRMNPDGTGAGTGVVFFTTNSTGQLAFLDNMVGISQSEFTPEGGTIRTWEWKGGTIPFENLIPQP
jgi:ribosomal protein S8E